MTTGTSTTSLPSALDAREDIVRRAAGRRPALFLDYDGTLAPIVDDPEEARLPIATTRLVARLSRRLPVSVVSGRGLEDVRGRVGLDGLYYAGSHGFEIRPPGGERMTMETGARPALDRAEARLRSQVGDLPGVRIERKPFALAVHYRQAGPDAAERARSAVEREATRSTAGGPDGEAGSGAGGLRRTEGREVSELRPAEDWDKGRAVLHILELIREREGDDATGHTGRVPVYVGDDVTDEDAFRAVRSRGGVGILVREGRPGGPTAAEYTLPDPDAVAGWLHGLADDPEFG